MTYGMVFAGEYRYMDEASLNRGLTRFADAALEKAVTASDLVREGLAIRIRREVHAPSSSWFGSLAAITALAESASAGHVDALFRDQRNVGVRIHAGGDEEELPPSKG